MPFVAFSSLQLRQPCSLHSGNTLRLRFRLSRITLRFRPLGIRSPVFSRYVPPLPHTGLEFRGAGACCYGASSSPVVPPCSSSGTSVPAVGRPLRLLCRLRVRSTASTPQPKPLNAPQPPTQFINAFKTLRAVSECPPAPPDGVLL